jgi:putative flippase GtrA
LCDPEARVGESRRRLVLWVLLGVSAAVVELLLLRTLYETLGWPLTIATAVAAETLILTRFFISDRWIFGFSRPTLERLLKYHGASAGALVVYWLAVNSLAAFAAVPYAAAFILATGASFGWSLATNFLWVWGKASAARQAGR